MQVSKVISRGDLMILINEVYLSKKSAFSIKYPFYNLILFNTDTSTYEVRDIVTEMDFNKARDRHIPESDFLSGDLPRFTDFRDCLITSTFLPFENFDFLSEKLIDLADTIKIPGGRAKPLYLALDTNLIYLKFFSRFFPQIGKNKEKNISAINFRIALSDLVKEEIDANIKYKYRASNLKKMKKKFGYESIVDELFNCSARKSRIAKSAENEIKYMMSELEAERAESDDYKKDKEERDRLIAKSYSKFEKERNGEVLLLTADEDMTYHANNLGLLSEILLIPHDIVLEGNIEPCHLVNLIYDIALTFGVIQLSGTGVTVFGEWKGKGLDDYNKEHLRLWIEKDSRILRDFERDLRIAKGIDELS